MVELLPHKYGEKVRITRDLLLAADYNYYQQRFFEMLRKSRETREQLLESIEARRRLKQKKAGA